ncbi:MAG: hypothetical protein V7L04_16135 [Nostoc sp.]|uniref:hypothetical protein n=1 Tax=Nostoc sp. TaxID=1180 RepID=UPI002FFA7E50
MGEVQRCSRTRYRYANGGSRRSDFSVCRASCYNGEPLRWTASPACSRSVSPWEKQVAWESEGGFTSRLRRETRLKRWIHRNALASLRLEWFVIP